MYKIASQFSWKKLASGSIVLDLEKGEYFTLNDTAAQIWDGLVAGREVDEIINALAETYDVSVESARQDTAEAIDFLVREGVLVTG